MQFQVANLIFMVFKGILSLINWLLVFFQLYLLLLILNNCLNNDIVLIKQNPLLISTNILQDNIISEVTTQSHMISTQGIIRKHGILDIMLHLHKIFTKPNDLPLSINDINLIKLKLFFWHFNLENTQLINSCFKKSFIFFFNLKIKYFILNIPQYKISWFYFKFIQSKFIFLCLVCLSKYIYPGFFIFKLF